MVRNRSREYNQNSPEASLTALTFDLVGDSGEPIFDRNGISGAIVGVKRELQNDPVKGEKIVVVRFDDETSSKVTEEVAATFHVSVGTLQGLIEVRSAKQTDDSSFEAVYYLGERGVQIGIDTRHNTENVYLGQAQNCAITAIELDFGELWARSAKEAEASFDIESDYRVVNPSAQQFAAIQTKLEAFRT